MRSAVFLIVVVGLAAAWRWTPLGGWLDVATLVEWARPLQNHPLTPLLTIGAYVLAGLVLAPITMLIIATTMAFGPLLGFIYSLLGCLVSATLTYGFGVALAAFAGVLAAPIYSVNPNMGADLIITVFAVVVIGGMGSILGSIVTGFGLGVIEGLTRVFYPEASSVVIFVIMAIVLLVKPAGLFGRTA